MRLAIINGPNLNLVGIREKHIYGSMTMDHFLDTLAEAYPDIDIVTFQSNVEGELVNDKAPMHDSMIVVFGCGGKKNNVA